VDGAESGTPGSYGDSPSGEKTSYTWIWISVLLLILALTPVVIWAVSKSEEQDDQAAGQNEVLFQKLDTAQIVGKIVSK
jgi:flagellar basal body-associated protein FliL